MKKLILSLAILSLGISSYACDICYAARKNTVKSAIVISKQNQELTFKQLLRKYPQLNKLKNAKTIDKNIVGALNKHNIKLKNIKSVKVGELELLTHPPKKSGVFNILFNTNKGKFLIMPKKKAGAKKITYSVVKLQNKKADAFKSFKVEDVELLRANTGRSQSQNKKADTFIQALREKYGK